MEQGGYEKTEEILRLFRSLDELFVEEIDAAQVAAAFERRGKEDIHHVGGNALTRDTFTEADDVGVVMGTSIGGMEFVGAHCGTDAGNTVGGHAHADAGTADKDAEGIFILEQGFGHSLSFEWIVAAGGVRRAEVMHIVAFGFQVLDEEGLQVEATVVGSNVDGAHSSLRELPAVLAAVSQANRR